MINPFQTRFAAIFQNEVLLNSKRVVPYALMILFALNAALWWARGPAVALGWATNSEYYIVRNLNAFSFLTGLPIFNAVIMCDPVIRDFRFGIDPLLFSKPISRGAYLLGKFAGNFFVLVCCQSAFILALIGLQLFRTSQMVVQPFKLWPYFKHFFFFLVISHLLLAAFYFTVGTLTRNANIVYGLAVAFYPLYISYQIFLLKRLPQSWTVFLDPILLNSGLKGGGFLNTAEFLNQFVIVYTPAMLVNRALTILFAAICLTFLYARFATAERSRKVEKFSVLNLSTAAEGVYYPESSPGTLLDQFETPDFKARAIPSRIALPEVVSVNEGIRANVNKLIAALAVDFRLLRAERSLIVLIPLAIFLSTLDLAFYQVVPEVSYSATYASGTANALLLFLVGITVFYTGEAMRRDREVRIEPVLWATPAPNHVFLLSKFFATLLLSLSLVILVGLTAITIQLFRGHHPVEIVPYLMTYSVILLPSVILLAGASVALNVLLRDKYLAYAVSIGTGGGLFYLYSVGYNHWLYNPLLYHLWKYADLTGAGSNRATIVINRIYCLSIACACLALAHIFYERISTKKLRPRRT